MLRHATNRLKHVNVTPAYALLGRKSLYDLVPILEQKAFQNWNLLRRLFGILQDTDNGGRYLLTET